jgi:hypothetical protein
MKYVDNQEAADILKISPISTWIKEILIAFIITGRPSINQPGTDEMNF